MYIQGNATTTGNFAVSSTTQADQPTLFVNSQTGYVGIGMAAPGAKLGFPVATNAAGGIDFGGDVTLYRSDTNVLRTDDTFSSPAIRTKAVSAAYSGSTTLSLNADSTITFTIGSVEKVRINSSGLVGIGLTNPTSTLSIAGSADIRGNATTTGNLIVGANTWDAPTNTLTVNGSGYFTGNFVASGNATTSGNFTIASTTSADRPTMFVDSQTGRVGIGTMTPVANLDINGGTANGTIVLRGGAGGVLRFGSDAITNSIQFSSSVLGFYTNQSFGMKFFTNSDSDTGTPEIAITDAGLVGIETSNPLANFNVNGTTLLGGNASTTGNLVVNATANSSTWNSATNTLTVVGSGLFTGSATTSGTLQVVSSLATGTAQPNSTTTANFGGNVLMQNSATTSGAFSAGGLLYVKQDTGYVGIGTAAPNNKLSIGSSGLADTASSKISVYENNGTNVYGIGLTYVNGIYGLGFYSQNSNMTNSPKMVLTQNGKVGIGISSPTSTLTVNGSFYAMGDATTTGNLIVGATSWAAPTNTLTVVGSTYITGNATTSGTLQVVSSLATGTAQPNSTTTANFGGDVYIQGIATTTGNFAVSSTTIADRPALFVDSQTGNVSIGTSTSAYKLNISNHDVTNFVNVTDGNNHSFFKVSSAGNVFGYAGSVTVQAGNNLLTLLGYTGVDINASGSGANVTIKTGSNERMRITSTGLVGIGLTNPTSTLSVAGSADIRGNATTTGNLIVGANTWDAPTNTLTVVGSTYITGNATTTGQLVVGAPTGGGHGAGTISAQAVYDDNTQISAPDYVFDDPDYVKLSVEQAKEFVDQNAHLPWVTGRDELTDKKLSIGQRLNQILEAVENIWIYIVRLFDKSAELENRIAQLETEVRELKAGNGNDSAILNQQMKNPEADAIGDEPSFAPTGAMAGDAAAAATTATTTDGLLGE